MRDGIGRELCKKMASSRTHAFYEAAKAKKGATTFNIKVGTRGRESLPSIPTTVVWPSAATRTITDYREPEPCARDGAGQCANRCYYTADR